MMIKLENLSVGHQSTCLESLNIGFTKNEITLFLGSNGIGKSCLLNTMCGSLSPLGGRVNGLSSDLYERSREISYCYQSSLQDSLMTVKDYLSLISPFRDNLYGDFVKMMGVEKLLNQSIGMISGGEKQRVKILSCLLQDSKMILLDEPTNSLDPFYVDQLIACLRILKKSDCMILLATHDLNFAIKIGDRFIGFKDKTILFDCTLESLIQNQTLDSLFEKKFEWYKNSNGDYSLC